MASTCRRLSVNIEVRSSNIRQQVTEGDDMLKLNDAERKVLSQERGHSYNCIRFRQEAVIGGIGFMTNQLGATFVAPGSRRRGV